MLFLLEKWVADLRQQEHASPCNNQAMLVCAYFYVEF